MPIANGVSRLETIDHGQLRRIYNARVRVVVDVHTPGAAVSKLVTGEFADETGKAGRGPHLRAQCDAVYV